MLFLDYFILFLDLLAGFSAFMIGLLFLTVKSKNRIANIFLVIFLWSLSWLFLSNIFIEFIEENSEGVPYFLDLDLVLAIVPSIFLYILVTINRYLNPWYLLLYLPTVLINIFHLEEGSVPDFIFILLFPAINLPLMVIAFILLKRHKKKATNYYSELEYKTLSWIKSIIITILAIHFFIVFGGLLEHLSPTLEAIFSLIETLINVFIVYWVGYNGFFQARLFVNSNNHDSSDQETALVKKNEPDKESQLKFEQIESKIHIQKLFKNPTLNLRTLASLLDLKEKELSSLINQNTNTNFYNFINAYRVAEFKELLSSPKAQQLTISGLAEEAGFSSKSTFYSAFKSLEGMTPKEYEMMQIVSE